MTEAMPVPRPGGFPQLRLRRNRNASWVRDVVAEHRLAVTDLVWPVFVVDGDSRREPVASMPGVARLSIDLLLEAVGHARRLGIRAVAPFPHVPAELKDTEGSLATNPDNLVCRAIRALREAYPDLGIICDVALDPFTTHGHDGVLRQGDVDNDATLEVLEQQARVQAAAGCDTLAPSDMMDGRVGTLRQALDRTGYSDTRLLAYAAKYASSFYGPFRDAIGSAHKEGAPTDKRSYQMDPANGDEALREVALDLQEGADMVMVKPGMPYLDVLSRVKQRFAVPTLAYQVSGEYAMMATAASQGALDFDPCFLESLLAFKRAGADAIFSYGAVHAAELLARS